MNARPSLRPTALVLTLSTLAGLGGCAVIPSTMSERECMARVMYFESNRSSDDGMLAVGTVVMNRVNSPKYPDSVCEVVGQPHQFAPGALTKPIKENRSWARAQRMAGLVLRGKRHPGVQKAMFFHTAGYSYPYHNMHYVLVAGGNAFYEKRKHPTSTQQDVMMAAAEQNARPLSRYQWAHGVEEAPTPARRPEVLVAERESRLPEPARTGRVRSQPVVVEPVVAAAPLPEPVYVERERPAPVVLASNSPRFGTRSYERRAPHVVPGRLPPLSIEDVIAMSEAQ